MRLENFSDQAVQVIDKHLSVFSSSGSLDRLKVRSLIEQVSCNRNGYDGKVFRHTKCLLYSVINPKGFEG